MSAGSRSAGNAEASGRRGIEVPVGATSKNAMVPLKVVNTKNILFICGGAFPDLTDIIKERLNKQSSIGFHADLKDKYDNETNLMQQVTVEDLRKYGMIPNSRQVSNRLFFGNPDRGYDGQDIERAAECNPAAVSGALAMDEVN